MFPRERRSLETKSLTGGFGSIVFFRKRIVSEKNKKNFKLQISPGKSSCVEVKNTKIRQQLL
jgi:hypothetical protein